MVIFLFALAILIALLQLGLMGLLRQLVHQIESERRRIDALEAVVGALASVPAPPRAAPTARGATASDRMGSDRIAADSIAPDPVTPAAAAEPGQRPAATRERAAKAVPGQSELDLAGRAGPAVGMASAPLAAMSEPSPQPEVVAPAGGSDAAALRSEMLALVHQLVGQGMSLRDIATHCGLSEAEAELMLSLQGEAAAR